jgi:hypothetical protein
MHASSGSNTWSTQTDHCCVGQFQYRVFKTIWLGWFWTSVLLISSYWLAMMTGISHSHQLWLGNFDLYDWSFPSADLKSCPSMPGFNCCYCVCCSSLLCFLSFFLLPTYSFFIPPFFSFFFHLPRQLFLNYLLYHVNICFCRQVPIVNVTGFLVCR